MSTKRPSPRMMAMLTDVAANNGGTLRNRDQHLVTTRAAVEGHGWVTVDRGTPDNRGGNPSEYRYTLTGGGLAIVTAAGVTITPTPTDMDRTALVTAHQLRLMKKGFTEREALAVAMQKATMGLPVPSDPTPASSPDQPAVQSDVIGISVVMGDATAEVREAADGEPMCISCGQWVPVTTALTVRPHRRDDSLTREWCRGEGRAPAFSRSVPEPPAYDPRCVGCGEPWRLLAGGAVGHADGGRAHGCAAGPGNLVDRAMVAYWSLRPWQRAQVSDDVAAAIVRGTLGAPCGICSQPGRVGDDGRLQPHAGAAGWCRGGGQPPVGSCAAGTYRVAYLTLRPAHMATAEWADMFRERGLTAREAAGYANNGFGPAEAADWHAAGFGPHEAPAFADLGHTPAEAVALADATFADV